VNEHETGPGTALPPTGVPEVRRRATGVDRRGQGHDDRRRRHAGQPGVLPLCQKFDEEVESGDARRDADPHGNDQEDDKPRDRPGR
jgi:hypothetical protein